MTKSPTRHRAKLFIGSMSRGATMGTDVYGDEIVQTVKVLRSRRSSRSRSVTHHYDQAAESFADSSRKVLMRHVNEY